MTKGKINLELSLISIFVFLFIVSVLENIQ